MAYQGLLVLLDQDPLCAARTQLAIQLARACNARITGLAPTGRVDLPGSPLGGASIAEFAALAWDTLCEQADAAAQRFRKACLAADFKNFEVQVDEDDCAPSLLRHAHSHDLTLLSQADPAQAWHAHTGRIVEQVVLFSARPTLVLPYAGSFSMPCETIMVAWDESREAARAVSDALPLLHQAKRIHVVTWKEGGGASAPGARPAGLDALRKWLSWHEVAADMHTDSTSIRIADAMLNRASDLEADLIVMGAYGHTRWSERVLGGATRGLLGSMTMPVLMSH
jgi:nucleotide-binding universal stress UspA family protein